MLTLISGLSGSGKSVAIKYLEDCGFYCVDNIPPLLIVPLIQSHRAAQLTMPLAVSLDARFPLHDGDLADLLHQLEQQKVAVRILFLEARDEVLVRRYAESRRMHPLIKCTHTLSDALKMERDLFSLLRDVAHVVDTSQLSAPQLRQTIAHWLNINPPFALMIESFGFKYGIPTDVDYVFDVRALPNPYYDELLRPFTGKDDPIINYFKHYSEVVDLIDHIEQFLRSVLPLIKKSLKNHSVVAIGCTGGQHRSVYVAEELTCRLADEYTTQVRHRHLSD